MLYENKTKKKKHLKFRIGQLKSIGSVNFVKYFVITDGII